MKILKKILICIYNLQGGGAERVLINLLNSIDYREYKVTLLVLKKEGIYLKNIPEAVKVIFVFKTLFGRKLSNKVLRFFSSNRLYKMFVKEKYDVEISFLEGYATKVISGSFRDSLKIAWVHADFKTYHWTNNFFTFNEESTYYGKFNKIVCVSNRCLQSFKEIFGYEKKLKTIYNLLDKNLETYNKVNFKNVFKNDEKIKIICVGRLEKEKGVERLIEAFKEIVHQGYDNINLYIVGNGSLKENILNLIDSYNLRERVKLISFKDNIYDYILSSDYVIVPSFSESFCMVLAEAICLNKMCISTDTAGTRELLDNGEYGILVENSIEGIKNGIIQVLKDESLKNKYESKLTNWSNNFKNTYIMNKIYKLINAEKEK